MLNSPRNSLFAPFGPVQVSCQKNKFLRATTALRPPGSGVLSPDILAYCPRFHENRFVGRNSAVLSLRAEGQRVEEPKGPRVKASQAGVRGDKMRWVLSIMSWSAMQVRSRQLAADHRRDGARLRWPQIGGRIAVLADASGWCFESNFQRANRRCAAVCVVYWYSIPMYMYGCQAQFVRQRGFFPRVPEAGNPILGG